MDKVFISYRRDTGQDIARGLNDRLTQRGIKTFFDRETLHNGKFNQQLLGAIRECRDFILVFSKGALDRCVNPDDWVRTEIECALKLHKNIVIVYTIQPLEFPANLPASLNELKFYQGVYLNHEYYNESIDRIINHLETGRQLHRSRVLTWGCVALAIIVTAAWMYFGHEKNADSQPAAVEDSVAVVEEEQIVVEQPSKKKSTPVQQAPSKPVEKSTPAVEEKSQPAATQPVTTQPVATQPVATQPQTPRKSDVEQLAERAASGDAAAACQMGLRFLNGDGVSKNFKTAFAYFNQSASAGNIDGMYWLGYCYRMGRGTSKDLNKAKQLWKRAASAGNARAAHDLEEIESLM
ncbi:MAG: TIR domain-containing protein [Lachnoclostridium sp.]|nr:TIR domain-containing protein [Lachnoclostridium sp.]